MSPVHGWNVALMTLVLVTLVAIGIRRARHGHTAAVRTLPGIATIERAVATSVAAGRPVFFVPGSRDLDNMQTVAAVALLEPVAAMVAERDGRLVVPTNRSMVMEAARTACRKGYADAGCADAWHDDQVLYISDDPLGFVAQVDGMIVREKPGACFFFGFFASESLLLAEGGRQVGAIQVAGTASPVQLPFFVAACDDTLMGEELFAASASLSGDAALLGSLRGQDLGKMVAVSLLVVGGIAATVATVTGWGFVHDMAGVLDVLLETR